MTASAVDVGTPTSRAPRSPLPALAGTGALAAFATGLVTFGDPMAGARDPAAAAAALADSAPMLPAVLMGAYAVLAIAVTGGLAVRLGHGRESTATGLLPVLGAAHVLLLATAFVAPAAAVAVGTQVFDTGVSATGAEAALLVMNLAHPMSAWLGAGFLAAVALASRGRSRGLTVVSAVFAVGLLLPPVGWAVTYLMAFWFAGTGIWLWRRG